MVNEEEIIRVAKLMKIDLEEHVEHVSRVKKMLEYFDILDQIDLSSEEITAQQKSLKLILKSYLRKIKNKNVRTRAISILCQTNAIEPKEIASPSIAVNPAIKTKQ